MKKTRWRQRINRPYLAAAYGQGDGCEVCGLKKLKANMMKTAEFTRTSSQSP